MPRLVIPSRTDNASPARTEGSLNFTQGWVTLSTDVRSSLRSGWLERNTHSGSAAILPTYRLLASLVTSRGERRASVGDGWLHVAVAITFLILGLVPTREPATSPVF